ncbi:LysR family transcriptional regulator [Leekyejoonella antrihumi]|nr:LysR family transcriptional regulator [Leekyejoonella antrihumi]
MLDTNRLRVFRAVVASGSVGAAATHLGYTPSAISQQIAALQRETGLTLFEKSGRGITATATGRVLAAESDELMGNLSRLSALVDDLRDGRSIGLSIGCFASAGQIWMPPVAKALREEFPDALVTFNLNELGEPSLGHRPEIDVRTEAIDGPVMTLPGHERHVLHEESYYLVMPRDHALSDREEIPLSSIAQEPWVDNDRSDSTCSKIVARACRAAGFSPRYVARCEDHYTAIAMVGAGVGVTVLPRLPLVRVTEDVTFARLVEPEPRRRIVAIVRDGVRSSPVAARALELLDHAAAQQHDTGRVRVGD